MPIRIDPTGAREAVLLLHGFSGYPGELAPLAEGLASAGYAVRAPRFPGHGTCRRDFMQTKAEDWARSAFDAYLEARCDYGTVHVAGHSMGGLLASAVAISFDAPRLILLAPAFELAIRGMGLTPFIAPFKGAIAMNRPVSAADSAYPARYCPSARLLGRCPDKARRPTGAVAESLPKKYQTSEIANAGDTRWSRSDRFPEGRSLSPQSGARHGIL